MARWISAAALLAAATIGRGAQDSIVLTQGRVDEAAMQQHLPRKAPELAIGLAGGKQALVSSYRGKVVCVAFILTTCSHCQNTTRILSRLQNEFGPRGLQVLGSAIETGSEALVPKFIEQFQPPFPVGFNTFAVAQSFLQHSPLLLMHVPCLAFIDRQGSIVAQYEGNAEFLNEDAQEKNIRGAIENLLKQPAAPARKTAPNKRSGQPRQCLLQQFRGSHAALRDARVSAAAAAGRLQRRFEGFAGVHARIRGNGQQNGRRIVERRHEHRLLARREALRQRRAVLPGCRRPGGGGRGGNHRLPGAVVRRTPGPGKRPGPSPACGRPFPPSRAASSCAATAAGTSSSGAENDCAALASAS